MFRFTWIRPSPTANSCILSVHLLVLLPLQHICHRHTCVINHSVDPVTDAPVYQFTHPVEFSFAIPRSVWENPSPRRLVQYGHGLLYNQNEIYIGWLQSVANEYEWVLLASDWLGMSSEDEPAIVRMISTDCSDFYIIPDRSIQGFVAMIVIMKAALSTAFVTHPALTRNGTVLIDTDDRVYLGRSQGSVLGGALMALHPFVERATFGVGGNAYSILLPRAVGFVEFFEILKTRYTDPLDLIVFVGHKNLLSHGDKPKPNND